MSYNEIFRSACESLGEGHFELVKSLLAPHLGEDPFSVVFEDPKRFLQALRVALGNEADQLVASLATTLRERGADVDKRTLERALEAGDRERVRSFFDYTSSYQIEDQYRELLLKQFDSLGKSRRRRVIISSVLLGAATFLMIYLITMILRDYITETFFNGLLTLGFLIALALSGHNYLINIPSASKTDLSVVVKVRNPSAPEMCRIPALAELLRESRGSVQLDLAELSRLSGVPLADLVGELVRLQRDGAIKLELKG